MSSKVDWKQKYFELRSKYINAIDIGFRLGVEEGKRMADMENMQMQLQQAQEQLMAAQQQMAAQEQMPPEEEEMSPEEMAAMGEEEMPPEEMAAMGEEQIPLEEDEEIVSPPDEGDNLENTINELEKYVSKNEKEINFSRLMKNLHNSKIPPVKRENNSEKIKEVEEIISKWSEES